MLPEGPVNTTYLAPLAERFPAHAQSEKLAAEITELAAYIFAATQSA